MLGTLALAGHTQLKSVAFNKALTTFFALATIIAPPLPETLHADSRAPVDIVAVLDRSTSMHGQKMEMLHKTMSIVVKNMEPRDRLSIVAYDDVVTLELPLTLMDQEGKDLALRALQRVTVRGSTNLSGGLSKALEVLSLRDSESSNKVASVLLLTDGLANIGITSPSEIVRTVSDQISMLQGVSLYTFGFGADHDAQLLARIAEVGRGSYYFVKDPGSIVQAFADCIGGLMSVVAQNIQLVLSPREGVTIKDVRTKFAKQKDVPHKGELTIEVGDMFAEERRDFLVEIDLPKATWATPAQELVQMELTYLDVMTSSIKTATLTLTLNRTKENSEDGPEVAEVTEQIQRVDTATVLEHVLKLTEQGKYDEAKETVSNYGAHNTVSSLLASDLNIVLENIGSFVSGAIPTIASMTQKHWLQRDTEISDSVLHSYSTSNKENMRKKFNLEL